MLYLIDIAWERLQPDPERPAAGRSTYPTAASNLTAARRKARNKFNRKFGNHLRITAVTEKQDPAGIFQS